MGSIESSGKDLISRLPCSILETILGSLTLKEAARTSVLSKRWQYLWTTRRHIEFDIRINEIDQWIKYNPRILIPKVLSLHQGPLSKFTLRLWNFILFPDVSKLVDILSKKKIQELSLQMLSHIPYDLSLYQSKFKHLRSLYLDTCVIDFPSESKGFPMLVDLELVYTRVGTGTSGRLSGCPLLQRLKMRECYAKNYHIEIDAPKLVYFELSGTFKSLCFINTPVLAEVRVTSCELDCYYSFLESTSSDLIKLFDGVPAVRILHLSPSILKCLFALHRPEQPLPCMDLVEVFRLCNMAYNRQVLTYAFQLIRNMPNLSMLEVDYFARDPDGLTFFENEIEPSNLSQLKKVVILRFLSVEPEIALIRYILACAPALEVMLIRCGLGYWDLDLIRYIEESPRASGDAEILWKTLWQPYE